MASKYHDSSKITLICVDSMDGGAVTGRYYYGDLDHERNFHSLDQFLLELDQMMDGEVDVAPCAEAGAIWRTGKLATFKIRIIFRQNSSWQGTVTWLETRHEENFRSALELLSILHQALAPAQQRRMRPSSLRIAK